MVKIKTYPTATEEQIKPESTIHIDPADFDFDLKKVIIALDRMSVSKANDLIVNYEDVVYGFKINHLLDGFVRKYRRNVFLDYKLHDIPNTMNLVVERCIKTYTSMITIHMNNSEEAIKQLEKYSPHIKLLGVTALTSMSEEDCQSVYGKSIEQMYERSIKLMERHGFWGAICSPHDLHYFKHSKQLKKICPGIQITPMNNDQIRTATPQEALEGGADYLVMGRAILEKLDENFQQRH